MNWTPDLRVLVLTVYSIILLTGVPCNLLSLCILIRKAKQDAKPIHMILLSLNISDLIFLISLPIRIKETADNEWNMSYFFCPLAAYIFVINFFNSTLLLMTISVERYLAVFFAIQYKLKRHPRHTVIISIIIWVVNMSHCTVVFYMEYHFLDSIQGLTNGTGCYWSFNEEQMKILVPARLVLSIVEIFIPLMICCFCYINIIRRLSLTGNIKPMKRFRAIGLAISTLLVFMICFIPLGVCFVEGFIGWNNPSWRVYAMLFSSFNACLDPFIFYFSSKSLQKAFSRSIRALYMLLHNLQVRLNITRTADNRADQIQLQSQN
ncbi:free fatty acid receptor 2-like [Clarias gariepinus]|uniref:free fatty acid receptor 2-like n=1 Tax=Clarias gariepinus TaxID=13013 RepID=UPI00234DE115|nr:free fatty acid receptor 2-like [Clarias gariepinus]